MNSISQFSSGQQVAIDDGEPGIIRGVYLNTDTDGVEVEIRGELYHFGIEEMARIEPMEIRPSDRIYGHRRDLVGKQRRWLAER